MSAERRSATSATKLPGNGPKTGQGSKTLAQCRARSPARRRQRPTAMSAERRSATSTTKLPGNGLKTGQGSKTLAQCRVRSLPAGGRGPQQCRQNEDQRRARPNRQGTVHPPAASASQQKKKQEPLRYPGSSCFSCAKTKPRRQRTGENCAGGGTRTHTGISPADFESAASAISPHRRVQEILYHTANYFASKTCLKLLT